MTRTPPFLPGVSHHAPHLAPASGAPQARDGGGLGRRSLLAAAPVAALGVTGLAASGAVAQPSSAAPASAVAGGGRHGRRRTLRFGVNYTPSKNWWHLWNDFDERSVRDDLRQIASLGFDHIRVFCMWPLFQPDRAIVSERALGLLDRIIRVADDSGLDVSVDFLQGHLSSFEFFPGWTVTNHKGSIFADPRIVAGQRLYVRKAAARIARHRNVLGSTLGNEMNLMTNRQEDKETPQQIGDWLDTLLGEAERAAPGLDHVHSEFDNVWFWEGDAFRPEYAATKGARTVIHSWVFGGAAQTYGPLGTGSVHFAEYLTELARSWHRPEDLDRTLWLQEIGAPLLGFDGKPLIPEGRAPEFAERTVRAAARCAGLWGITWWCSHDVSRDLPDFPELEYSLGLIGQNGRPKPIGVRLSEIIREFDRTPPRPAARTTAVVFSGDRTDARIGGKVMNAFMDQCSKGRAPAIVRAELADDAAYLKARGITDLIRP
ncbi:glycosyl hydrolase [Streptomyces sp. NPDC006134]|uniref:glycoside hydrolase 5 family protein n=1 Tax=Streptomyces sp. NPDC006134 TaxID=3154467 RepID=UPI0033EEDFB8